MSVRRLISFGLLLAFLCLGIVLFGTPLLAQTAYYVNTAAAAGGDGTTQELTGEHCAWDTVADVNAFMASFANGDSVLFNRGCTWQESLIITKTGLTDYLTFGAYGTGAKPKIWQAGGGAIAVTCTAANVAYIHLDNLEVYTVRTTGNNGAIVFSADNLSHIWISNILVSQSTQNGIFLQRINTYLLEDSTVHDCDNSNIVVYGSATYKITNGIIRRCISYNSYLNDTITIHEDDSSNGTGPNHLIEDCECYNSYEGGIDLNRTSYVTVRGCYCHDNSQGSFQLGTADHIVIENSWSVESSIGTVNNALDIGINCSDITVRYCIFYYTKGNIVFAMGTTGGGTISNVYFYNNVAITTNNLAVLLAVSFGTQTGLYVKNNIFINLAATPGTSWVKYNNALQDPSDVGSYWDYNHYYVVNLESTKAKWYSAKTTLVYTYASWKSTWSQDAHSSLTRTVDPLLINGSTDWSLDTDFQIPTGSPCKDAGVDVGLTEDYAGNPIVGLPDIGAYEYQPPGEDDSIIKQIIKVIIKTIIKSPIK